MDCAGPAAGCAASGFAALPLPPPPSCHKISALAKTGRQIMNFGNGGFGLIGLLIFVADVWAILNIVQSGDENLKKAIWIAVIVVLPVLGLVLWFLFGPRGRRI
jgi:hypothetical protein